MGAAMIWTVLWWCVGVLGGLVALWLLIAAAGLDSPRRALRGRGPVLACGACGHEAVDPSRITACPECGALYSTVGLLTPRAALRCGPPLVVVVALLLVLVGLGSALLAPIAARAANTRTIGAASVEEVQITHSFIPTAGYALAIHQELLRAQPTGTWSQNPPVLEGSIRVVIVVGANASSGINHPSNRGLPTYSLELPFEGNHWRLVDSTRQLLAMGDGGAGEGMARLFDAGGVGPGSASAVVTDPELDALAELAEAFQTAAGGRPSGMALLLPAAGVSPGGMGTALLGCHTFHRAAPWGIAAGVGTAFGLLVVAAVLLAVIRLLRKRLIVGRSPSSPGALGP